MKQLLSGLNFHKTLPVALCMLSLAVMDFGQQILVPQFESIAPSVDVPTYGIAQAQASKKKKEERKIPLMQPTTFDRLGKAQELSNAGDHQGALELLQGMLDRARRYNNNEIAQIHREIAGVYNDLDQMDKVLFHYEQILNYRTDIREGQETAIIFVLAQLYMSVERFDDSLRMVEEWLSLTEDPGASPFYFVATVYYQMKNYDQAIFYMEKAITLATEAGQLPIKKGWYNMLKFLYFEQDNLPKVLEILEIMVKIYPDRSTWVEMAGVFSQLGEEKKQVYAMEAAHASGLFEKEQDFRQYAGLLMNAEAFIRGAWYLQQGFDNEMVEPSEKTLSQLGQAYSAAWETDRAIEAYEDALEFAENGRIANRLSKLYYDKEEYGKCIDSVDEALKLGDLGGDEYDTIHFKGMCYFWRGSLNLAEQAFNQVRRDARRAEDRSAERGANNWLRFVNSERNRLRDLEESERM